MTDDNPELIAPGDIPLGFDLVVETRDYEQARSEWRARRRDFTPCVVAWDGRRFAVWAKARELWIWDDIKNPMNQ